MDVGGDDVSPESRLEAPGLEMKGSACGLSPLNLLWSHLHFLESFLFLVQFFFFNEV